MFLLHGLLWMLLSLVWSLKEASVGLLCVLLNTILAVFTSKSKWNKGQTFYNDKLLPTFDLRFPTFLLFFSCFQLFSHVLFNIGSFVNCLLLLKLFLSQDWRTFAVVHVIVAVLVVFVKLDLQVGVNLQSMRYSTRTLKTHHVAQAYIKLNI